MMTEQVRLFLEGIFFSMAKGGICSAFFVLDYRQ